MQIREFLVPEHFSGLHVERENMIVHRHAKKFAVIDGRRAPVESVLLNSRFEFNRRPPDLSAGFHIDGKGPLAVDHVHHAFINGGRRQFALVVHEAGAPDGHQSLDIGFIDLLQRAVTLPVEAHALGGDVFRVLAVVQQLFVRLGQSQRRPETKQHRAQPDFLHDRPSLIEVDILDFDFRPAHRTPPRALDATNSPHREREILA